MSSWYFNTTKQVTMLSEFLGGYSQSFGKGISVANRLEIYFGSLQLVHQSFPKSQIYTLLHSGCKYDLGPGRVG